MRGIVYLQWERDRVDSQDTVGEWIDLLIKKRITCQLHHVQWLHSSKTWILDSGEILLTVSTVSYC